MLFINVIYTTITTYFLVGLNNPVLAELRPEVYYIWNDPKREIYAYVMEDLRDPDFTHLDSADDISIWIEEDIRQVPNCPRLPKCLIFLFVFFTALTYYDITSIT